MRLSYPLMETREGAARLLVPDVPRRKGPGTKGPWPFYNGTMAVSRDLSAVVLAKWPRPLGSVLDGLAATGIWGIRMALEADLRRVAFNDRSPPATDLIRANLDLNGLTGDVLEGELSVRLSERPYDFVDIDPFGPPTPFLDVALEAAQRGSGLGITATDTAVLCGTYPVACERRYGSCPMRGPQGGEIGLRILLGYCARLAAANGKSVRPILAFGAEHFLRVQLIVETDPGSTEVAMLSRLDAGAFGPVRAEDRMATGPLWRGALGDARIIRRLSPSPWTSVRSARLLSLLQGECELPPFFVTTDELASREHGSPPKLDRFLEGLRSIGYRAARTHFHPRGVKTDAPYADIVRVFRERMPSGPRDD